MSSAMPCSTHLRASSALPAAAPKSFAIWRSGVNPTGGQSRRTPLACR